MRKLAALALLAFPLLATDLAGFWSGNLENRFGEAEDISFRFIRQGTELTGKLYGDVDSTPVREIKVEGDQIRFSIVFEQNGGSRQWDYTGTISGNEIRMERVRVPQPGDPQRQNPIPPQTFTLKKVL
ncbi:MAG TPA: hypothetical protein VES20_16380 [Bryobacteraceae bacterium]|nr:hypothetical protein [Bryobacteraceae bacterium]